jgi:hypothetical protein
MPDISWINRREERGMAPIQQQPIHHGNRWHSPPSGPGFNPLGTTLAIVVLLGGCTQTTLTAGGDLGTAGQKAALAMKQATVLSDDQLAGLQRAMTFHNRYIAAKANVTPDETTAKAVADFEAIVATQNKFLESLAATYAALAALADSDPGVKFNTAFAGVVTDTNSFTKALSPNSTGLPKTPTTVVQQVGSFLVSLLQRQQVIKASEQIRVPLQAAIDTMSQQEQVYEVTLHIYVAENRKALSDLYRAHLLSCAPVVDGMGSVISEKSVPNTDQLLNSSKALAAATEPFCDPSQAMQRLETQLIESYETSLKALRALLPLHDKLEAGETLDLSSLIGLVNQIKPLAQLIKP